jgi:hypothetical protein
MKEQKIIFNIIRNNDSLGNTILDKTKMTTKFLKHIIINNKLTYREKDSFRLNMNDVKTICNVAIKKDSLGSNP